MDDFMNSIITSVIDFLMSIFEVIINFIFSSQLSTILFGLLFMNVLGFVLMRLDKKYAQEEKRRIKESTLFLTALLFGSLGVLAGMYKFRHKTLHKSFTIGIPLIIVGQVIFVIYNLVKG